MRSNLCSIFIVLFILPAALLSFSGQVFASTPAELQKDLLRTEKDIPSGGRWTIRMTTKGYLLSERGVLDKTLLVFRIDTTHGKKSDTFRTNTAAFFAIAQDAVSSGESSELLYKDEHDGEVWIEAAIWDFATEGKAQQFMSVVNRLSAEAMAYAKHKASEQKKVVDAQHKYQAEKWPGRAMHGYRHVTSTVPEFSDKFDQVSTDLGDEGFFCKKLWATDNYHSLIKDWKFISHTRVGGDTGENMFFGYIRKSSRVLVIWSVTSPSRFPTTKNVIDERVDGRGFRAVSEVVPALPYPQVDVTSIIRAAYHKMAHESPASDPRNVIIQIFMPKTDHLKACKQTVFGPAFPDFKTAIVEGAVSWGTVFYEGRVTDAPIYITLFHKGKLAKRVKSKVDDLGYYKFSFGVNKKGNRDVVKFEENISRELFRPTALMHDSWVVPPSSVKPVNIKVPLSPYKKKIQKMLQKSPPSYLLMFENVAYIIAMKNDVAHQMKTFSKETPNLDKFWKNTKTPDGVLTNALMVLGEVYTSKDSALSAAKNADDHLKDFRKYLKSKGCKIFPDAGIGKPKSGIQLWLKNIGMTDYYILNADK